MGATQAAIPYERPAFTPWPARDPDPLQAAADYAARHGFTRHQQDAYARGSHARAVRAMMARPACTSSTILPLEGLVHDAYPRLLTERQASRMPVAARAPTNTHSLAASDPDCALSCLAIFPQADGVALVLITSAEFCALHGVTPAAHWLGGLSLFNFLLS